MKARIWETTIIALASVLVALIEWSIAEQMPPVFRIALTLIAGIGFGAILIGINIKSREK